MTVFSQTEMKDLSVAEKLFHTLKLVLQLVNEPIRVSDEDFELAFE